MPQREGGREGGPGGAGRNAGGGGPGSGGRLKCARARGYRLLSTAEIRAEEKEPVYKRRHT